MPIKSKWTTEHTVALLAMLAGIFLIGLLVPQQARVVGWLLTMLLLALFAIVAGQGITGYWHGILIDYRNRMSLSRFQMVLWTILILSAILTATLANVRLGVADPIAIAIPTELWLLMGISTTALIGSPLILSGKEKKPADDVETARTFDTIITNQGVKPDQLDNKGQVIVNATPDAARWSDMFRGEEVGNGGNLDLAKIQMFYFTLVLVLAYGAALASMFGQADAGITSMPALDASMVALLGISQAGYLTSKAIPHS